ncbi:MAG TPA: tetratricopeptide repeat protein [Thermoanaerobaculia bacterium]|nr:tetratricopeptide repeat protein [Thermoanaerobaculia bacterium]
MTTATRTGQPPTGPTSIGLRAAPAATAALLAALAWGACAHDAAESEPGSAAAVTFTRDVAPILYRHCLPCHRAGEAAPFELRTWDDARRHARLIAEVTERRYMPPWLPDPDYVAYRDVRRLSDEEIATLARWVAAGAPEGNRRDLPPEPDLPRGWRLGEPDLVVTLPEPYPLAAEGADVIRNFVVPLEASGRFVSAVELRPGSPAAVHHANVLADTTGTARQLDLADPEPGYEGMVGAVAPGGHFLGWTPGRQPRPLGEGMAWAIEEGTDLVLQIHLLPTGRAEAIQPRVGLHWSAEPPRRRPATIHIGSTAMDIPPGDDEYPVTDSFEIPVEVEALSIYPHAHYRGKSMEVWAERPDGATVPLLRIGSWDFDWQDEYWFAEPVVLPAGTRVHMRYTYDNSEANPRNPFSPPRRARWGPRSTDVMGDAWLQVVAREPAEDLLLRRAIWDKDLRIAIDGYRLRLADDARDLDALARLGRIHASLGEADAALGYLRRALALDPESWLLHFDAGLASSRAARHAEALEHFRAALARNDGAIEIHNNLAATYLALGRSDEARAALETARRARPDSPEIATNLAVLYEREGRLDQALVLYAEALRGAPEHAETHGNVGTLLLRIGRPDDAERHLREALRLRPFYAAAWKNLANLLATTGREAEAIATLREAVRLEPTDADAHYLLALGLAEGGEAAEARRHLDQALRLRPGFAEALELRREIESPGGAGAPERP